jgi:hypothetical protein
MVGGSPGELHRSSHWKVCVTAKEQLQLTSVATLPARPRTCTGKISLMMIHGMAPMPREKAAMYTCDAKK